MSGLGPQVELVISGSGSGSSLERVTWVFIREGGLPLEAALEIHRGDGGLPACSVVLVEHL